MWRFQSSDHEYISLHDHVVDAIISGENDIILVFNDGFDVTKTHPLNDTQKAKHTTEAQIILKAAHFVRGEVNYTVHQEGKEAYAVNRTADFSTLIEDFKGFKVCTFEVKGGMLELLGVLKDEFTELSFSCTDIVFCWNDYSGDAWFERF